MTILYKDKPPKTRLGKMGRPHKTVNMRTVAALCRIHARDEEIVAALGINEGTLKQLKKNPEFRRVYDRGKADGKMSLRRMQWTSARRGNVVMQIFLGKALLGQNDRGPQQDPVDEVVVKVKRPNGGNNDEEAGES